jgi:hypothetical protein
MKTLFILNGAPYGTGQHYSDRLIPDIIGLRFAWMALLPQPGAFIRK